jgi:UDP-N-acetylmuramoylalanine--D-glutamate ligase
MIVPANMTDKSIGILGLSRSGLASLKALDMAGARLFAHDDQITPQLPDGITQCHYQDWPWDDIDMMVISPGIPHLYPAPHPAAQSARDHNVPLISDIELMMTACPQAKTIGITGTNGKSTIVSLIDHILTSNGIKTAVGGNIGTSVLNLDDPGSDGVIILELSSYQLEITPSLELDAGGIINITPDHLDRHGGWDGYVKAKANLARSIRDQGLLVLGDDAITSDLSKQASSTVKIVGFDDAPDLDACPDLAGPHNALNAAMAIAISAHFGLAKDAILSCLPSFRGLPHRMEEVVQYDGIRFVNDSKATNGEAAAEALKSFDDIYWIAGGMAKEDGLGPALKTLDHVRQAYLIGSSAEMFAGQIGSRCSHQVVKTMDRAVRQAFDDASADTRTEDQMATIMLSPAAASFDQFDSFEHRGDVFRDLVSDLTASPREGRHV